MLRKSLLSMSPALLLVFLACGQSQSFTVCARPNVGFLELVDDQPVGLEIDLLESFASTEGLELELTWLDSFAELLPAVESGRCDIGASAVTVTEDRAQRVDFSETYFPVRALVIQRGDDQPLALDQLAGQRVAAVGGTVHVQLLRDLGVSDILEMVEDEDLFAALASGNARALVCDSSLYAQSLDGETDLMAVASLGERSSSAFVLGLDSPLREPLNASITMAKSNGTYRQMLVRHFGEDATTYVMGQTAEEP